MSVTANAGPYVSFGQASYEDNNPQEGPSLFYAAQGILDPRSQFTYAPGSSSAHPFYGFLGTNRIVGVNACPVTLSATLIAAAAHTTSGTKMTLASAAASGLAVGVSITRQDTGVAVTGLLELDPAVAVATATIAAGTTVMNVTALSTGTGDNVFFPGMTLSGTSIVAGTTILSYGTGTGGLGTYNISTPPSAGISGGTITGKYSGPALGTAFGSAGTVNLWNPACLLGRAVSITSTTSQVDASTFTVRGFDVYGFPMTEVITLSGTVATTTNGKKAFKYILSVTPNTTDGTGSYSVGTTDIIGLPIRSDTFQAGADYDVSLMMNNAAITSSTGYTKADKTTATASTGDVRGTYALQTASNGTLRFISQHSPVGPALLTSSGLFGVPQYADF